MEMQYFEFRSMSTQILLGAEGTRASMQTAFRQARAAIEREASRFTRFSQDSELSALNRESGSWCDLSPEMFEVLALSQALNAKTGGLFEPGVLDALERAGYDRGIDDLRLYGPANSVYTLVPLRTGSIADVLFDEARQRVRLPAGLRIDLGGIAKGWIAARAIEILSEWSQTCVVDAGGDMFLHGLPQGQATWQVALEDPRDPEQTLTVLNLPAGAAATSSVMKRRWQQSGQERHHLIDPRTGLPAVSDWLSVTAIAGTLPEAEVYAKALLIAGPREAKGMAAQNGGIEFIAVDKDGKLWGSKNSREYFHD